MTIEALLGALIISVLGVLVTMLFKRTPRNNSVEHQDEVRALVQTTAAAVGQAIATAMENTAGGKDPAYWERIFDEMKRLIVENLRGQGVTHSKLDELFKEIRHGGLRG